MDASDSLVITLGLAMLIGSIVIAAVIGLLACGLVKAVTAKQQVHTLRTNRAQSLIIG